MKAALRLAASGVVRPFRVLPTEVMSSGIGTSSPTLTVLAGDDVGGPVIVRAHDSRDSSGSVLDAFDESGSFRAIDPRPPHGSIKRPMTKTYVTTALVLAAAMILVVAVVANVGKERKPVHPQRDVLDGELQEFFRGRP